MIFIEKGSTIRRECIRSCLGYHVSRKAFICFLAMRVNSVHGTRKLSTRGLFGTLVCAVFVVGAVGSPCCWCWLLVQQAVLRQTSRPSFFVSTAVLLIGEIALLQDLKRRMVPGMRMPIWACVVPRCCVFCSSRVWLDGRIVSGRSQPLPQLAVVSHCRSSDLYLSLPIFCSPVTRSPLPHSYLCLANLF